MLFTDSFRHTERLTDATTHKLRASDSVDRYQDCGWHCATGYKDGRVQIMVHANSKAELDAALGVSPGTTPFAAATRRPRKRGTIH
jgi:hypothetical protein